jgi:hypothetical protein
MSWRPPRPCFAANHLNSDGSADVVAIADGLELEVHTANGRLTLERLERREGIVDNRGMDPATEAAGRLAELLERARPMPLMRGRVRVDKREVYRLVDAIVASVPGPLTDRSFDSGAGSDVLAVAEDVREALRHAYPVPLTDEIRLPAQYAAELARRLRSAPGIPQR